MMYRREWLLALAVAGLVACSHPLALLKRELRSPGERFAAFPEEVWADYSCDEKALPFFELEQNELLPRVLRPGQEFNHRFSYALCPTNPSAVVNGALDTRILHKGVSILRDAQPSFDLKPGRWVVDAFVVIPDSAAPGIYSLRLEFRGTPLQFSDEITFVVEPARSGAL